MSQKIFYNDNAEKFIIHKSKFNHVDVFWQALIDVLIWNHIWKSILDYWCGSWEIAMNHLHKWADFVLWVDVSKELLLSALKKTINKKNIEFLSIDDENYCFDKMIPDSFFDIISSYYVFCTIKDRILIEEIVKTFHKKLKGWWKVLMLMPNRNQFNWKVCYWFSFIKKNKLQEGDAVVAYLRTNDRKLPTKIKNNSSHLKLTDYFRPQNTLKDIFIAAGFQAHIHEILIEKWAYKWIIDESNYSPIYVLEANKTNK